MTAAVYTPLVICGLLGLCSPWLSTRLPPGSGAWTLTIATLTGGVCTLWTLGLLGLSLVDDLPGLARRGAPGLPVADGVSALALALLAGLLWRVGSQLRRQRRLRAELRVILALPGIELVVLPHPQARAFAVPGRPGRIVATDTMLRALTPAERQVMLAHERAHLHAAHPLALALAQVGAAANPMLRPAARAVAYLSERHADERAAAAVGDRALTAQALATAALATAAPAAAAVADTGGPLPAFHQVGVVDRVIALHTPRRRGLRTALLLALGITLYGLLAAADATDDFVDLVGLLLGR